MKTMITTGMIQRGLELGLIKLIDSPNDGEPACKIGDYWFYYAGSEGSGMNSAEYIANVPMEEIVREINDALEGLQRDNREEYAYYEAVLLEHGLGTKAGESFKTLWIRAGMSISISEEEEQVLFSKEAGNETLKALFLRIVAEGRTTMSGDCYVPFSSIETFNREYGTNYEEQEFGFCL